MFSILYELYTLNTRREVPPEFYLGSRWTILVKDLSNSVYCVFETTLLSLQCAISRYSLRNSLILKHQDNTNLNIDQHKRKIYSIATNTIMKNTKMN